MNSTASDKRAARWKRWRGLVVATGVCLLMFSIWTEGEPPWHSWIRGAFSPRFWSFPKQYSFWNIQLTNGTSLIRGKWFSLNTAKNSGFPSPELESSTKSSKMVLSDQPEPGSAAGGGRVPLEQSSYLVLDLRESCENAMESYEKTLEKPRIFSPVQGLLLCQFVSEVHSVFSRPRC